MIDLRTLIHPQHSWEVGVWASTLEVWLPDAVLVLAVFAPAVDDVVPVAEGLLGAGLVVAAGVVAAALPVAAGADVLDAVHASPLCFDFLLFVDFVVEFVSWEVVEDWLGVV